MGVIVILTVAFAAGSAVGCYLPTPLWALPPVISMAAITWYASHRTQCGTAWVCIAAAFALGWVRPIPSRAVPTDTVYPPCQRVVEGQVVYPPTLFGGRTRLTVELERWSKCLSGPRVGRLEAVQGRLLVTVLGEEAARFRLGDRVRLRSKIKSVQLPRNFGDSIKPLKGPVFTTTVPLATAIALVQAGAFDPRHYFGTVRWHRARFWNRILEPEMANLARALTLGETAVLDSTARQHFRRTGTAHLLSVSGLHLGLVVFFSLWIVRVCLIRIPRLAGRIEVGRIAAACAVPAAVSFALLAGCRVPVVRAAVMATSTLTARVFSRSTGAVPALSIAAMALLIHDPKALFQPGFQLSFAAVMGFFFTVEKTRESDWGRLGLVPALELSPIKRAWAGLHSFCRLLFRSSLAAAAATTPIVLAHFGTVSLVAVPVNVIAVPVTSFLIMPGLLFVTLFAGILPGLSACIGRMSGALLGALSASLEKISALPCTLDTPGPLMRCAVVTVCAGVIFCLAQRRRGGMWCLVSGLILGLAAPLVDPAPIPRGKLTVDFLDVGQGDTTLITFPNGAHWLVDSGGSTSPWYNVGERIVVPVLRSLGVRALDRLILTHPDRDHVGGAPAVFQALAVVEIWDNGQGEAEGAEEPYHRLLNMAEAKSIPVQRTPAICGKRQVAGVEVAVLHPCEPGQRYDSTRSFNDNSIVITLTYGMANLLLAGDIERETEDLLVHNGVLNPVDVIKLPHHGSGTSTSRAFLDATLPKVAIASLGLFNAYGFPHQRVQRRLGKRNIGLLRTDLHGGVRLVTDGRRIEIRPFKKRR